jgi:hypothetical protein
VTNRGHTKITVDKRAIGVVALLLVAASGVVATVEGASFDYGYYESLLNRHAKSGVFVDGVAVTAVDYAALAAESKEQSSDYSALLGELAIFKPETLEGQDDKKAFWINVYNIAAIKTIVDQLASERHQECRLLQAMGMTDFRVRRSRSCRLTSA